MGEETETHTSEESDYELQQSISSSSDRKKLHWSVVNEDGWKWWWGNGYGTQAAKSLGQQTPACLKDSLTHKSAQGLLTSVPKLPNINVRSWYFDVD